MIRYEQPTKPKRSKAEPQSNTANWRGYAEELDALEVELDRTQTAKKDIYKAVRELHGRVIADALKTAMRLRRMKDEKRQHAEEVDAQVFEILKALGEPLPSRTRARPQDQSGDVGRSERHVAPPAEPALTVSGEHTADASSPPIQAHPKDWGPAPDFLIRQLSGAQQ